MSEHEGAPVWGDEQKLETSAGKLTAAEACDRLIFASYCRQRDMGFASERLLPFFDVAKFEPMYRDARRLA